MPDFWVNDPIAAPGASKGGDFWSKDPVVSAGKGTPEGVATTGPNAVKPSPTGDVVANELKQAGKGALEGAGQFLTGQVKGVTDAARTLMDPLSAEGLSEKQRAKGASPLSNTAAAPLGQAQDYLQKVQESGRERISHLDPTGKMAAVAGEYLPMVPEGSVQALMRGGKNITEAAGRLGRSLAPKTPVDVIEYAKQHRLPITVGTVYGGNLVPKLEALTSQAPIAGATLRKKAQQISTEGKRAVEEIAQYIAPDAPRYQRAAGSEAGNAMNKAVGEIRDKMGSRYDKLFDQIPKDVKPKLQTTRKVVDEVRQDNEHNPEVREALTEVETLLGHDKLNAQQLKFRRPQIEDVAKSLERKGRIHAASQIRSINKSLDAELGETAAQHVPNGAKELRNANRFARAAYSTMDDIEKFVKNTPDERLISDFFRLANQPAVKGAKGADIALFNKMNKRLAPEVMDRLASFKLQSMGLSTPGKEGTEIVFSPRTFVTEWKAMSPQAREALFSRRLSQDQMSALDKTVKYFDASSPASLNSSGTAAVAGELAAYGEAAMHSPIALLAPLAAGLGLPSQAIAMLINRLPRAVMETPLTADNFMTVMKEGQKLGMSQENLTQMAQIVMLGIKAVESTHGQQ